MSTATKVLLWIIAIIVSLAIGSSLLSILVSLMSDTIERALDGIYLDEHHSSYWESIFQFSIIYGISSFIGFVIFYWIAPMPKRSLAGYTLVFIAVFGLAPIVIGGIECGSIFSLYCLESELFQHNEMFGVVIGCVFSFLVQPKVSQKEMQRYSPKHKSTGALDERILD